MENINKRNTAKEKTKENKHFPYRNLINKKKWRVVDDSNGKSYGEYRNRKNALDEMERLNKVHVTDEFALESLR